MIDEMSQKEQDRISRVLSIIRGSELDICLSDNPAAKRTFMSSAYRQATEALSRIAEHAKKFQENTRDCRHGVLENELFQYAGNVIAFVGQRGAGKTQTMLTFAREISSADGSSNFMQEVELLRNCRFFVMSPIAPSSLGKPQNFLQVALSRIYRYVDDMLKSCNDKNHYDDSLRIELYKGFNRCVSGIAGIEDGLKGKIDDISSLQDVVDGISLRESFYELIELVLKRVLCREQSMKAFLVLQLDDADSQIKYGYDVLEDVRRYLQVPNLVILMSTDMEMLHSVILQNHMRLFPDLISNNSFISGELPRMCRKYIDKLIPPSQIIHLPRLEQYADLGGGNIQISYLTDQGNPALDWAEKPWPLQDFVLMLIFRKTGIIFVSHKSQLNHIIPRSLRGLNQLIYMMSKMEDIPAMRPNQWGNPRAFKENILEQYQVASENLERFSDYFCYDWIDVKVRNKSDREFLRRLVKEPQDNFIPSIQAYFKGKYEYMDRGRYITDKPWTLYDLDSTLMLWESESCSSDEYMLFFTIGTIRTIRGHIAAWHIKWSTTIENAKSSRMTVFDFDPLKWHITSSYPLVHSIVRRTCVGKTQNNGILRLITGCNDTAVICKDWQELCSNKVDNGWLSSFGDVLSNIFTIKSNNDERIINVMNFITLFLRLGTDVLTVNKIKRADLQKFTYQAQEVALQVALNWDVVARIGKRLDINIHTYPDSQSFNFVENLIEVFAGVDKIIAELNNGTIIKFCMENKQMAEIGLSSSIRQLFKPQLNAGALSSIMDSLYSLFSPLVRPNKEFLPNIALETTISNSPPTGDSAKDLNRPK